MKNKTGVNFEESSICSIPSHWEIDYLGNLFDIQSGKAVSQKTRAGNPQYPFLRTLNVLWGKVDTSTLDHMHFTTEQVSKLHLHYWDLLVCEGGDIGRTGIWRNELKQFCGYQNHVHRLRVISKHIWPMFYAFWMNYAILLRGNYTGEGVKTTIPNLSKGRLKMLRIPKPPIEEQKTIAKVLFKIQKNIEHQTKTITVLNRLKKSIIQKLYHQGTKNESIKESEIGVLPNSWLVAKLGDHFDFTKKPKDLRYSHYPEIPFVPMDLIPIGKANFDKFLPKSIEVISSGTYFEKGDLLVAKITPSFENGKQGIMENLPLPFGIATTEVIPIKDRAKESDKYFLHYYLLKDDVRSYLTNKMDGSTGRQRISKELLESLLIPFPPNIQDQIEIASIISSIEKKISSIENKHLKLGNLFNTMLNSFMRGEIDLKRTNLHD